MAQQFAALEQRTQLRTDMGFVKNHGHEAPKQEKPPLKSAGEHMRVCLCLCVGVGVGVGVGA